MSAVVQAFAADQLGAARLAAALGLELKIVQLHVFPDREVLPTVAPFAGTVIMYCPLNQPNAKLMSLMLACDAWRRAGAARLVLVAPYMCYLRQDTLFAPGQALSRDVIGRLLGERFDRIVTVEPHLHRTSDLGAVFAPAQVTALSAAGPLAGAIGADPTPVVIGPDGESEPWARAIGEALGAPHMTLQKTRQGDHRVHLALDGGPDLKGRRAVIIDDICSSGGTLEAAIALVLAQGAEQVEIAVVHALFDWATARRLAEAGASRVISTDTCPHPSNAVAMAPILAAALTQEMST